MTEQTWRLDPIGDGNLAWLYLIPHAVNWHEPADAACPVSIEPVTVPKWSLNVLQGVLTMDEVVDVADIAR